MSNFAKLLTTWNLSEYIIVFQNEGYDDVNEWPNITFVDLICDLNIKKGHARKFMRCVREQFKITLADKDTTSSSLFVPIIKVIDSTSFTTKLLISSGVLYDKCCIEYKLKSIENDEKIDEKIDEKNQVLDDQEWKNKIILNSTQTECILQKLQSNATYVVRGRLSINASVKQTKWCHYTNPVEINTLNICYCDNFDIIYTTKDYPKCDYDIPFVFKTRVESNVTLFVGCDAYEILGNNQNIIRFYLAYVCLKNDKKERTDWYRIQSNSQTDGDGILCATNFAYVLRLEFIKLAEIIGQRYEKQYSQAARNGMEQMYYTGNVKNPVIYQNESMKKGSHYKGAPSWFECKTIKKRARIIVC
eukprot:14941_1